MTKPLDESSILSAPIGKMKFDGELSENKQLILERILSTILEGLKKRFFWYDFLDIVEARIIPSVYDLDGSTKRYLLKVRMDDKTVYLNQNEIGERFYQISRGYYQDLLTKYVDEQLNLKDMKF